MKKIRCKVITNHTVQTLFLILSIHDLALVTHVLWSKRNPIFHSQNQSRSGLPKHSLCVFANIGVLKGWL